MCLIAITWNAHPRYKLIFAANRDEFYERETEPAGFWEEAGHVLAGRDWEAGGTWCGITRQGRFAAVTNVRKGAARESSRSRGLLVSEYLLGNETPRAYVDRIKSEYQQYAGFNLLVGDRDTLLYTSNAYRDRTVGAGTHGLSNATLNSPWPKVKKARKTIKQACQTDQVDHEKLLDMLTDRSPAMDEELPDTGVGPELEKFLSPNFIRGQDYGTRSSTIILMENDGRVRFSETRYNEDGIVTGRFMESFKLEG